MHAPDPRLLKLIGDTHGLLDLEEFRLGVFEALKRAIPCDWISINEVPPAAGGDHWEMVEPALPAEAHEIFGRYIHQNPLLLYTLESRNGTAPDARRRAQSLRPPGDFDEADRNLLNEARPYLIQSYRNAVAFESLRTAVGSEADLAAVLGISRRTAEKHVQNAFAKLGRRAARRRRRGSGTWSRPKRASPPGRRA